MSNTTQARTGFNPRVVVQKVGTSLSNMVMPNLPALIAWGLFTAFFIEKGWIPVASLATIVGPMIHLLLPLLIANTGGRMVYEARGAVVGVVATMGVIAGSDWLVAQDNAPELEAWIAAGNDSSTFSGLPQVHMFIGAMIMAPLAAWLMKKLDQLIQPHIPAGFEMLVNMFSAGFLAFATAIAGFFGLAPIVNGVMHLLEAGVEALIHAGLLPLVSILIEPAKVFFLNNAINHGVLTPLGIAESAGPAGKSVLFLLEANPGPGLGILLAFCFFGRGAAKASAPGAAIIHFFGGIHEIYFPYVLMRPILLIAAVLGGMTGVFLNVLLGNGLKAPAAPGSILAIEAQAADGNHLTVLVSVLGATIVSFVAAAILLRLGKQDEGDIASATARMEQMKGKKSSVAGHLTGAAAGAGAAGAAGAATDSHTGPIRRIVFACDAGMGSSAMGATVLRKKVRAAGFSDVEVTNKAISSLTDEWDLIVTQKELAERAAQRTPSAVHVAVDQFMNSPRYDEVVELVREREAEQGQAADGTDGAVVDGTTEHGGAARGSSEHGTAAHGTAPHGTAAHGTGAPGTAAVAAGSGAGAAAGTGADVSEETGTVQSAPATEGPGAGTRDQDGQDVRDAGADDDVMSRRSIVLSGTAASAETAIDEAGALLVQAGAVDPTYVAAMHDRERSVSTFMGNGLAIPHGTNEAKSAIRRSGMSFVRYADPIDWNGNPVRFVVGIAGQGNEHLALLQNVAMTFSDPAQVERLERAASADEILAIFGDEE